MTDPESLRVAPRLEDSDHGVIGLLSSAGHLTCEDFVKNRWLRGQITGGTEDGRSPIVCASSLGE